ncbi:hypothetical protein HDU67_000869, partial [Dinochytrium kinnereticum]
MPKRQSYEVLDTILAHLCLSPISHHHNNYNYYNNDNNCNLLNAALVCRAWAAPALSRLYACPELLPPPPATSDPHRLEDEDDNDHEERLRLLEDFNWHASRRIDRFIRTLHLPISSTYAPYRLLIRYLNLSLFTPSIFPSSCHCHDLDHTDHDHTDHDDCRYASLLVALLDGGREPRGEPNLHDPFSPISFPSATALPTMRGLRLPALTSHVGLEADLLISQRLSLVELRIDGEGHPVFADRVLHLLSSLTVGVPPAASTIEEEEVVEQEEEEELLTVETEVMDLMAPDDASLASTNKDEDKDKATAPMEYLDDDVGNLTNPSLVSLICLSNASGGFMEPGALTRLVRASPQLSVLRIPNARTVTDADLEVVAEVLPGTLVELDLLRVTRNVSWRGGLWPVVERCLGLA